jgi:hypothetical protein
MTVRVYTGGATVQVIDEAPVVTPPPLPVWPTVTLFPNKNASGLIRALEFRIVKEGRYFRFQEPVVFTTDKVEAITSQTSGLLKPLDFQCVDAAGAVFKLQSPLYKLLVNGVERGRVAVVPNSVTRAVFAGAIFGDELDGEHLFAIQACNADGSPDTRNLETNAPHPFIVNRAGKAKDATYVYSCRNTWDVYEAQLAPAVAKLPKEWFTPKALPLPAMPPAAEFTRTLGLLDPANASTDMARNITRYQLAPHGTSGSLTPHHLVTRLDGTQHTRCRQGYTPDYYLDHFTMPNLDGPRNIGTHYHHILLAPGRGGKLYTHTYTAFVRINADGYKITRWGAYHKYGPDYTEAKAGGPEEAYAGTTSDPRLTGPKNHRLMSWGGDWDWKSLELDHTAAKIGGEEPHTGDTHWLAADERGYIVDIVGDGQDPNRANPDHTTWAPMDAKVLAEGFNIPRGLAHRRGTREILVSETGAHRIARVNMDTGAVIDYLIENPTGAQYGYTPKLYAGGPYYRRFTHVSGQTPLTLRALGTIKCLAPEAGCYYTDDDGEWYAFINRATLQVARINLATKQVQIVGNLFFAAGADPGNQVTQLCVNDNRFVDASGARPRGGFGVHGTLFAVTFYLDKTGHPTIFEPLNPGSGLAGYKDVSGVFFQNYSYDTMQGRGPGYANFVYPDAVGVGYGQCFLSGCMSGISVFRQAATGEPNVDRGANARGAAYWRSKGYDILSHVGGPHTPNGALPWGENADMDKWFIQHGHVKP